MPDVTYKIEDCRTPHATCQACGAAPEPRYVRDQATRDARWRYRARRTGRRRIDPTYWAVFAARLTAFDGWQDKMVCLPCYTRFLCALNAEPREGGIESLPTVR